MRQAGRSLPEYREIRKSTTLLEAVQIPELAAEITYQPVQRYGVDAAILYSDIMVPLFAIGFGVDIKPGVGPVIASPFRNAEDLTRIRPLEADCDTSYVIETIHILREMLGDTPLIGFAGAPFTLASYLVEGGPSKNHAKTKLLMHAQPHLWSQLMERLCDLTRSSLQSQAQAGCAALQVFDSWVGTLSLLDYNTHVLPHMKRLFGSLHELGVPIIHFGVNTGELLHAMSQCESNVIGVDWRVSLTEARRRVGDRYAIQGNLDPALCLGDWQIIENEARRILEDGGRRGHIFNLGHGVTPDIPPESLQRLVEFVHDYKHT